MFNTNQLKRYSKPRTAGDQTSGGRGKLLRATTSLTRVELVVRETLQNSWDARLDGRRPTYGARVYRVDTEVRAALTRQVFTDLPASLQDLEDSLQSPDLHAIEIFDRGTSGLDGPYLASEHAGPNEPNNFNSFVFDIGTTKESESAGGTFGFGKTATFEVSRAHSVVYWSRCRGRDGELEHRLIAATLHDPYVEADKRYTGAHWWGDPECEVIAPLRGERAATLGKMLFRTDFDGSETGTSILVIDPVIAITQDTDSATHKREPVRSDEHADALVQQFSKAISFSAWPKVVPTSTGESPMDIKLYKNRVEQGVATKTIREYQRFADALLTVRQAQNASLPPPSYIAPTGVLRSETIPIRLRPSRALSVPREEIFGHREDNVVGHLQLVESATQPIESDGHVPRNAVCLMRSEAELVVRYDLAVEPETDLIQWHGVFKPTPECDRHFAAAEPPTHDSWIAASAENEVSEYVVERTMRNVQDKVRNFLNQDAVKIQPGTKSVRGVSTALREFLPLGPVPDDISDLRRTASRPGGGRRQARRAGVEVLRATPLDDNLGQKILIQAESATEDHVSISVDVYAVTADGRMSLEDGEVLVEAVTADSRIPIDQAFRAATNQPILIEIRTKVPTALEVSVSTDVQP